MIISIASGKGGTGKTLVATSLALALQEQYQVTLADCDVEEPNDHIFFNPVIKDSRQISINVPVIIKDKCDYCGKCARVCAYHALAVVPGLVMTFPQLCHGCGACAYLCPNVAIVEEPRVVGIVEWGAADGIHFVQGILNIGEAMAPPVIREVKKQAGHDGIVLIDSPPGTSCPVVQAVRGSDFCLLVTEPTPFGLNDLSLAVSMLRELKIPIGVVLNRAVKDNNLLEDFCYGENVPVMLTIPLDRSIAELYSRGVTLVRGMPEWKMHFSDLFNRIQGGICAK
jgi:MinD superfamily P-loop ATPase